MNVIKRGDYKSGGKWACERVLQQMEMYIFHLFTFKEKRKSPSIRMSICSRNGSSIFDGAASSPGERARESDRYAGKTQVGHRSVLQRAPPARRSGRRWCLKMAVPLTSDLPGTSTEAGGDIQVRSESRSRLA